MINQDYYSMLADYISEKFDVLDAQFLEAHLKLLELLQTISLVDQNTP